MSVKYLVYPDYVRAADGDVHFITAQMLMLLYGVRPDECIVVRPNDEHQFRPYSQDFLDGLIHLAPRTDGNYTKLIATPSNKKEQS